MSDEITNLFVIYKQSVSDNSHNVEIIDVQDTNIDASESLHRSYSEYLNNPEYIVLQKTDKRVEIWKKTYGFVIDSKVLTFIYQIGHYSVNVVN